MRSVNNCKTFRSRESRHEKSKMRQMEKRNALSSERQPHDNSSYSGFHFPDVVAKCFALCRRSLALSAGKSKNVPPIRRPFSQIS